MAAVVGILFLAVPAANGISGSAGDGLAAGAALLAILPIATRVNRMPRLTFAVGLYVAMYIVGAAFFPATPDAPRQALTTFAAGAVILLFAAYGREMVAYWLFRQAAVVVALVGIAAVNLSGLPKNITGGAITYQAAFLVLLLSLRNPRRTWTYAIALVVIVSILANVFDFRALSAYSIILLLAYLGATTLPRKVYWLAGIVGSTLVIGTVTWYFLHVYTNELAMRITQSITDRTGRPATSGRDVLWPAIVEYTQDNRWFGLGVGMLPRDFLATDLSAHSFYMQTYLQLGFVGLAELIIALLGIWTLLAGATAPAAKFGSAIFLMFVVHNGTEVLMFQNGLIASIPVWCAIGLSLSLSLNDEEPSEKRRARRARREPIKLPPRQPREPQDSAQAAKSEMRA